MIRKLTSSNRSLINSSTSYPSVYYSSHSILDSVYSLASTSASTLDDPLPKPRTQFDRLLPDHTSSPISKITSKHNTRRNKRAAPSNILPKLTAQASDPRAADDLPTNGPTKIDQSQLSPHLPLVTRERNHVLANLRQQLQSNRPSAQLTWQALVPALQYPQTLPHLPLAFHPQSTRSTTDDGSTEHEPRSPISLTIADLRRTFTIFAGARPRTREGLSRLLVVVELLAQHSATAPLPPATQPTGSGRSQAVGQLRGGGAGLREQDWTALMLYAATAYRSPRATPEVDDAFGLFAQWEHKQANRVMGSGGVVKIGQTKVRTAMYNALLLASAKARGWALFELTEKRMAEARVPIDVYTLGIKLEKQARRGGHIELIWSAFEAGLTWAARSDSEGGDDVAGLWNMMLWALVRRGALEEGMRLYQILQDHKPVGLRSVIAATRSELYSDSPSPMRSLLFEPATDHQHAEVIVTPPSPTIATYSMLIQAQAHHGNLRACLLLLRDLITISADQPSITNRLSRSRPIRLQPTAHMYGCLFRGFAVYCQPPAGHAAWAADPHLMAGKRERTNALSQAESARPLDALTRLGSGATARPNGVASEAQSDRANAWTLPALKALLRSFLALEPSQAHPSELPHEGARTAPSSREVFWLLLAVERLTGGDSRAVVDTFERVEDVFGLGKRYGDGREVWTGWRIDKMAQRKVDGHRRRIREQEQEDLQEGCA